LFFEEFGDKLMLFRFRTQRCLLVLDNNDQKSIFADFYIKISYFLTQKFLKLNLKK